MNSELFACQFCKEFFSISREPYLLPDCGHSVCAECLKEKLETQIHFVCKEDGVMVSRTNLSDFPKNFALLQIIKSRNKNQQPSTQQAKFIEDHDSSFNSQSEKNFLSNSSGGTGKQQVIISDQEGDVERCNIHRKKLEIVCLDDRQRICANCALFGDHKGHNIINLKELMPDISKRVEQLDHMSKKLNDRAKVVFETSQYYNKIEQHFQQCLLTQMKQLEVFFDDLVKVMMQKRNRLVQDLKERLNHLQELYSKNVNEILGEVQRKVELWKMSSQSKLEYYSDCRKNNQIPLELIQQTSTVELVNIGDQYMKELEYSRNHIMSRLEEPQTGQLYLEMRGDFEQFLNHNIVTHTKEQRMENSMTRLDSITECSLLKDINNSIIQDPLNPHQMEQWIEQYQEMQRQRETHHLATYIQTYETDQVMKKSASTNVLRKASPSPMRRSTNLKKINEKFQPIISKLRDDLLEQADLSGADLGDDGLLSIRGVLFRCRNLRALKLAKNKIQDSGAMIFLSELFVKWNQEECNIQNVNLSSNLLTEKIVDKICELAKSNPVKSMKQIYLTQNIINNSRVKRKIDEIKKLTLINLII